MGGKQAQESRFTPHTHGFSLSLFFFETRLSLFLPWPSARDTCSMQHFGTHMAHLCTRVKRKTSCKNARRRESAIGSEGEPGSHALTPLRHTDGATAGQRERVATTCSLFKPLPRLSSFEPFLAPMGPTGSSSGQAGKQQASGVWVTPRRIQSRRRSSQAARPCLVCQWVRSAKTQRACAHP